MAQGQEVEDVIALYYLKPGITVTFLGASSWWEGPAHPQ